MQLHAWRAFVEGRLEKNWVPFCLLQRRRGRRKVSQTEPGHPQVLLTCSHPIQVPRIPPPHPPSLCLWTLCSCSLLEALGMAGSVAYCLRARPCAASVPSSASKGMLQPPTSHVSLGNAFSSKLNFCNFMQNFDGHLLFSSSHLAGFSRSFRVPGFSMSKVENLSISKTVAAPCCIGVSWDYATLGPSLGSFLRASTPTADLAGNAPL